ncbi:zinc finger protein 809-like [Uranotaenia lowii]|uniref:zinc finger protein 809-like n=1 Tax=Uranotaenia lowii TaxID=190385 RepID=UPI002479F7F3|nr:zinc finger protein 809-like [Uranotaenia lowii]
MDKVNDFYVKPAFNALAHCKQAYAANGIMDFNLQNIDLQKIASLDQQYLEDVLVDEAVPQQQYSVEMVSPPAPPVLCYELTPVTPIFVVSPEVYNEHVVNAVYTEPQPAPVYQELGAATTTYEEPVSAFNYSYQYTPVSVVSTEDYSNSGYSSESRSETPIAEVYQLQQDVTNQPSIFAEISSEASSMVLKQVTPTETAMEVQQPTSALVEDIAVAGPSRIPNGPTISYVEDAELGRLQVIENRKATGKRGRRPVAKMVVRVTDYKCTECDRMFISKGGLTQHINQLHSKERNFKCSTCGKWYETAKQLKVHEKRHDVGKAFPCQLCPSEFNYQSDLTRHTEHHHGKEARYSCKNCDKRFSRFDHKKRHEMGHFNNTIK